MVLQITKRNYFTKKGGNILLRTQNQDFYGVPYKLYSVHVPSAAEQDEGVEGDHAELADEHPRRLDLLVVNQVRVLKSRSKR